MLFKNKSKLVKTSLKEIEELATNLTLSLKENKILVFSTTTTSSKQYAFVTAEIATLFARQNKNILLVDLNFTAPTLHEYFQGSNSNGVSTLLYPEDACFRVESHESQLFYIPTGPDSSHVYKWQLYQRIEQLITIWWKEYEHIFLLAPPVLENTDTKYYAQFSDAVFLYHKKNKTKIPDITKAVDRLTLEKKISIGHILLT